MGWRQLLQQDDETRVLPWLGGSCLRDGRRSWRLAGARPGEPGWHRFAIAGRQAHWCEAASPAPERLGRPVQGFLVGDRLVPDGALLGPDLASLTRQSEVVHLLEAGLDRFARVAAARAWHGGPLVFVGLDFPVGPEDQVLAAYLDRADDLASIRGVPPALDAAFRIETLRRSESERRRREAEERRRLRELRGRRDARRQAIARHLGDGAQRRQVAIVDFDAAARAALAVGGAELLDSRPSYHRRERVLRFRFLGRRFECTCDAESLRIIDSGICLIDHGTGERGDQRFTLESLPGVIRQADREGRLVVFRHVDG